MGILEGGLAPLIVTVLVLIIEEFKKSKKFCEPKSHAIG